MNIEQWVNQFGSDIAAFALSLGFVMLYYLWLGAKVKVNPTYTIHGVNQLARALWVANVMKNPAKDIMAVQTLRNFIMGASLMASTATLLIIGTLTLSGQAESISKSWHVLNVGGTHAAELWIVKVLCLLADFIFAFFAFVMSVRLVNHVVFMINAPAADAHPQPDPDCSCQPAEQSRQYVCSGHARVFLCCAARFLAFRSGISCGRHARTCRGPGLP
jgi:uncharacterized membrane protein